MIFEKCSCGCEPSIITEGDWISGSVTIKCKNCGFSVETMECGNLLNTLTLACENWNKDNKLIKEKIDK